jgi:hypothetical protein
MRLIKDYFLRAKHWQLFLFLFGMFCVAGFTLFRTTPSAEGLGGVGLLSWVLVGLAEFSFLAWVWSLGSFLSSIVQPDLRLNAGFFRFALICPLIYLFAFAVFFQSRLVLLFPVIFLLHLFAVFCTFYSLYFVSKSPVLAQRSGPASVCNYVGSFFLFWFFPIGVWIVQPRVNRLYAERRNTDPLDGMNAS